MAARSLFLGLSMVAVLAAAGCAARPKTCYVTLSAGGQPTAEACETGPVLIVRPITETNGAFYVPPYILGALSYEGFVEPYGLTVGDTAGTTGGAAGGPEADPAAGGEPPNAAAALRNAILGEAFLMPLASDPVIPMSDAFVAPNIESDRLPQAGTVMPATIWDDADLVRPLLRGGDAADHHAGSLGQAAPANRIEPEHPRIDGEVRYRRPYEGVPGAAISPDLL